MPGKIHDQSVADGPARKAGARPPRSDRHPRLRGHPDDRPRLLRIAGKRHPQRFNLIRRRIRRIKLPREIIAGNFATGARQGG